MNSNSDKRSRSASVHVENPSSHEETRFNSSQMNKFHSAQITQRKQELASLHNGGFTMPNRGTFQPGPVLKAQLALSRSRFDLAPMSEEHKDHVERALSGTTASMHHNQVVTGVGMDLFGRMLRNVGKIKEANAAIEESNMARRLFNATGGAYSQQLAMKPLKTHANTVDGTESARLTVGINQGKSPHYNQDENSISLMTPSNLDETSHELQHARDHLHKDLDLHNPEHRIASELNAFTRQHHVSMDLTGRPPVNFEGRTPKQMAESYEGKTEKGYQGTLKTSLEAVRKWKNTP